MSPRGGTLSSNVDSPRRSGFFDAASGNVTRLGFSWGCASVGIRARDPEVIRPAVCEGDIQEPGGSGKVRSVKNSMDKNDTNKKAKRAATSASRPKVVSAKSGKAGVDRELMKRAQAGDVSAWSALYENYRAVAAKAAHSVIANRDRLDDLVSEITLRVWEKRDQYDPKWSVSTWIYRMAKNAAIDITRRDKVVKFHSFESGASTDGDDVHRYDPADESAHVSSFENVMTQELRKMVAATLALVPEPYLTAVVQRYFQHMEYDDMARIGGCTVSTARWRVSQGMGLFQAAWRDRYGIDFGV